MLLQYEIHEEDQRALQRQLEQGLPAQAGERTWGIWFGLALGMLLAIPAAYFGLFFFRIACCGVPLFVAIGWWLGLPAVRERAFRRALSGQGAAIGAHSMHLSEQGLHWVGGAKEGRFPREAIALVNDTERHVFVRVQGAGLFIIPKRALHTHGGDSAFLDAAEKLWGMGSSSSS